jgi:diguanylate cyclase (GGDEF)-like protein
MTLGAAVLVAHVTGFLGSAADLTFVVFGLGALAATGTSIIRFRPNLRWPWLVIGAGLLVWLVGGAARAALSTTGNLTASRSLVPDMISLPGYLLFGIGLSGIAAARRRGQSGDLDTFLDACVAALAALALAWVYLINPALQHHPAPVPVRAVLAAYPAMSVFIVGAVARIAFSPSTRRVPAFMFLLVAMSFLLGGDVLYMFAEAGAVRLPQSLLDAPYLVSYLLFTGCVLHPTMAQLTRPVTSVEAVPGRGRLNIVSLALIVPPAVLTTRGRATIADRAVLTSVVVMLTVATVWRIRRALRSHAQSEARLAHQASHDALTGLPNQHALRTRRVPLADTALLFVDIDRFKLVNDTYGHSVGDELLMAVASRLVSTLGPDDMVVRAGGDEFLVLLSGIEARSDVLEVAELVRLSFAAPMQLSVAEVYSSASVGVAFGTPGMAIEHLIRDADTAMYEAKDAGRDAVAVFDASMRHRVSERLELEHDLRNALERGELHLAYQPVVRYPAGPVDSVEVLLRWRHPERGELGPDSFIPVAEESGVIVTIGHWVLDQACRTLAEWRATVPGAGHLQVAVNVSARQLRDPELLTRVRRALAENSLPPDALCLELTESLLIDDPEAATALLTSLREIGVRLAIDDFGTGYSSLAYLKRFPVHVVKIDRSFVTDMVSPDTSDESLVAAIIAMAGALGLATVAEGVETVEQETRLVDLGCDAGQGFLYCRPVAPADLPAAIQRLATASAVADA